MAEPVPVNDSPSPRTTWFGVPPPRMVVATALVMLAMLAGAMLGADRRDASAASDRVATKSLVDRAVEDSVAAGWLRKVAATSAAAADELPDVASSQPLLASAKSTTTVELGDTADVDATSYRVVGVQIVDDFTSIEETRPAAKLDGQRWMLVEIDFTERGGERRFPPCGTVQTVWAILGDRTIRGIVDFQPPVPEGTYSTCGIDPAPRGRSVRWIAPIPVPEDATVHGFVLGDLQIRLDGRFQNRAAAPVPVVWMPFERPLDVGVAGDDAVKLQVAGAAG